MSERELARGSVEARVGVRFLLSIDANGCGTVLWSGGVGGPFEVRAGQQVEVRVIGAVSGPLDVRVVEHGLVG